MKQRLSVDLVELKGSNYQIGLEQGKKIQNNEQFEMLKGLSADVDYLRAQTILQEFSNGFVEEIKGIADGLNIDFHTALQMYSGYDLPFPPMGCTSFSPADYYVRNYDFSPELYDRRLVFRKPEDGFASIGFSQQIVGRLDGMNDQGLVVGLHLVNQNKISTGFFCTTVTRLVLEECKNVEEAINLITKLPHGHCYNYSLMDKHGNKCVIEASPEKQNVTLQTTLRCTNHFESESLRYNNQPFIDGSLNRRKILQELTLENLSPEEAYQTFNNEQSSLFFKDYRNYFGTLHTVVYMPETLEVMVGIGGNATPTKFSLAKWVNGEQIIGSKLSGKIDIK